MAWLGVIATLVVTVAGIAIGVAERHPDRIPDPTIRLHYHQSGAIAVEEHLDANGIRDGKFRSWYPDGTLNQDAQYAHGHLVKLRGYHRSGRLALEQFEDKQFQLVTISHPDE